MVWSTKFIKYRENKLTVTRYVQNVHHWHEHKHANFLVTCVINWWLLQASPHMQRMLSQLISVMNVTSDVIFTSLWRAFIPVSRYLKIIKIHQDFPELWSQMYCHVFMKHSVVQWQVLDDNIFSVLRVQSVRLFHSSKLSIVCYCMFTIFVKRAASYS